ncbi:MAG: hypothetical protein AAF726_24415 [Planctomycetota bacterium]
MSLAIALAVVLTSPTLHASPGSQRGKISKEDRAADIEAIEELTPQLESEDERDRMSALRAVADLAEEHPETPSKEAAEALADALDDDRLEVRGLAIELLSRDQHPEVAVNAVRKTILQFESNMWDLVPWLTGPKEERGNVMEAMRYIETSVRASKRLRDDRMVDALSRLLHAFPTEMRGEPVALSTSEALLDLGTRDAVDAVIRTLNSTQDEQRLRRIHMSLGRFARGLDIDDHPSFDDRDIQKGWSQWLRKNGRVIPKKLGKWTGPPPEDEDEDDDQSELARRRDP